MEDEESENKLLSKIRELTEALEAERAESARLRSRLRSILWEYIPKQRRTQDVPPDSGLITVNDDGDLDSIAGYDLGQLIGAGSFGEVFAGRNVKLGEKVAVKVLKLEQQLRRSDILALEQVPTPRITKFRGFKGTRGLFGGINRAHVFLTLCYPFYIICFCGRKFER